MSRSLIAALTLVLASSAPSQLHAQTYSSQDVVTLINYLGGWRGPFNSDGTYIRYQDRSYTASLEGTILTITEDFSQGVRFDPRNGSVCNEAGVFRTVWVFDTHDMQPTATVTNRIGSNQYEWWRVTLSTRGGLSLIRRRTSVQAANCPPHPWTFQFETKNTVSDLVVEFGSQDAANKLRAMVASAW